MDSRQTERYMIHLEELAGCFSLHAGEKQFAQMRVHDVSTAGAGVSLTQPLAIGTVVKLTFTAGDWEVAVNGSVTWCRRQSLPIGSSPLNEHFRLGVEFEPRNLERNLIFFHATRSTLKPLH